MNSVSANISASKHSSGSLELAVTNLITAWLLIVPWLIGGRFWWTQALGAVVGAVALALALSIKENRRTLWRFPVFWLGLLFLSYVACQALNPWAVAVRHRADILLWDMFLIKHVSWLPAGVSGNYFEMSTWRMFVYWLAPWLLVCAWWAAVKRRRSGRRLILLVFLNGLATAAVILVQKIHPPSKYMWVYLDPSTPLNLVHATSAGFISWDHAAMFLYLSLGAGLALSARFMARARSEGRDTGFAWIVLLGCLALVGIFFILGSRAGLVIACVYFVLGLIILLAASLRGGGKLPGVWAGALVLLLALAGLVTYELQGNHSWTLARQRYLSTLNQEDTRAVLRLETLRMMQPRFWLGWGAGSYRYVSPDYFREDYIFQSSSTYGGVAFYTDYAHSDWLQFAMEFGVVGASLALAVLVYWFGYAVWLGRRLGVEGWLILIGAAAILAHAAVDFPMFNTAVVALFCLLIASVIKTASLEARTIVRR